MAMEGVVDSGEPAGDGVEGEAALAEFVRQAVRSKREVSDATRGSCGKRKCARHS